MKKPELLAPAGDLERLKTAIQYGADAVYVGGEAFSLRTACDNFTLDQLKEGLDYAHKRDKKVYVAANVVMGNGDLEPLARFGEQLQAQGADGVILSDLGGLDVIRNAAPQLEIHISTQANITNFASAAMWHRLGASRVVLAREMSQPEVIALRQNTPPELELELFVHGAMCMSHSGRCLISNYLTGRDANKGECAQPCRWNYHLVEEKRPGEYMPVVEDERGSYFFNSKDLCLIEFLPEIISSGVSSLKIEGRVKTAYYVATVVKAYRQEIDRYFDNPDAYAFDPAQMEELCKVSHRYYSHGFWHGAPQNGGQVYETSSYIRDYDVVGVVERCDEAGNAVVCQRNKFAVGDQLEILCPDRPFVPFTVTQMADEQGRPIDQAPHAKMRLCMQLPRQVPSNSMLRKRRG